MIVPGHDPVWHSIFGCHCVQEYDRDRSGKPYGVVYSMDRYAVCPIKAAMQPASVDVRLDEELMHPTTLAKRKARFLFPGEFMLGNTVEVVNVPAEYAMKIEGKSSWGRTGLTVHITAGWVDPGFRGKLTLEMKNLSNDTIDLCERHYIAQVSLYQMAYPVAQENLYKGRYQGAEGVEAAKA